MRLAFLCLAVAAFVCFAEDQPESATSQVTDKAVAPEFTKPSLPEDATVAVYFESSHDIEKMVLSSASKEGVEESIAKYDGQWAIEVPESSALAGDYSLVMKSAGKHHAIALDLGRDFTFDKEEFVMQYEVNFMDGLDCGGAYVKLLSATPELDLKNFHDKTPYTIMFGPDKCGSDLKIHFIFRHQNPVSKVYEEKHFKATNRNIASLFEDKKTHLYTLVVRSDNSFEIYVDQVLHSSGNLLSDFEPSVNPPEMIDDPEDKKPTSWVDAKKIPDPKATKPDDWDEDAPQYIPDESATKPEGWLDDVPSDIPDPKSEIPEDWDSSVDGDWEAPSIPNPVCSEAPGCGEWTRPMVPNPDYRGKWVAPMIDNPEYVGKWIPKRIRNPNFFEDTEPYKMTPIRAIGLELWSMKAEIAFDNFFIGTSKAGADAFAEETWALKHKAEELVHPSSKSVVDGIYDLANTNPWMLGGCVAALVFILVLGVYFCCRSSPSGQSLDTDSHKKKTDEPTPDDEDVAVEEEEEENDAAEGENEEEEDAKKTDAESEEEEKPKKTARQRTARKE